MTGPHAPAPGRPRSRLRLRPVAAGAFAAVALAFTTACRGDAPQATSAPPVPDRERFVQVYVELRRAEQATTADTAAFRARKREILERHGITEVELLAFVSAHAHDLRFLSDAFDSIHARLSNPPDSASP